MIYILCTDKKNDIFQKKLISFVKVSIKNKNYQYKIIYCPKHIIEKTLEKIDYSNDIVLWHPQIARDNLVLLKKFINSFVVLEKKTILIQKISTVNQINENMAINHGFKVIYIDNGEYDDITNSEWKLVGSEHDYILTHENLDKLINIKNER